MQKNEQVSLLARLGKILSIIVWAVLTLFAWIGGIFAVLGLIWFWFFSWACRHLTGRKVKEPKFLALGSK